MINEQNYSFKILIKVSVLIFYLIEINYVP